MVTKVVTEKDVDNVTIVVNAQNQLESQVVIEEVADLSMPVTLTKDGKAYPVSKVGKLTGTDWLVFQVQEYIPPPVKETVRIPTRLLIEYTSAHSYNFLFKKKDHNHRIAYTLIPEDNSELKTGTTSSNVQLQINMDGSSNWSHSNNETAKFTNLPPNTKGEFEVDVTYMYSTNRSRIASVNANNNKANITVETEDKIYIYELTSPATVVDLRPAPSFSAELDCGNYTWTEETDDQGQYLLGTATQPATITVVPTNFTADDVSDIKLLPDGTVFSERNGLVLTLPSEQYADVTSTSYPIGSAIEVILNDGSTLRSDIHLECPITK